MTGYKAAQAEATKRSGAAASRSQDMSVHNRQLPANCTTCLPD
jgi:hypothetical protein